MLLEGKYPALAAGGVEFQVRFLARSLRDHGSGVRVVAPMLRSGEQREDDVVDGIAVHRIRYPDVRLLGGVVLLTRLGWYLLRHRDDYDVIHAHVANKMAAVACVVGRGLGKTVVVKLTGAVELNDGILKSGSVGPRILLLRWAMRRATFFQAISAHIAGLLRETGFRPETIRRIPNAVDTDRFAVSPRSARSDGRRIAVYLGRLVPEKGLESLLAAWGNTVASDEDAELRVIGDGPLRSSLERQVARLGVGHQVRFLGATPQPAELVREADFCILPSLAEGLSNTLLEQMSAAKPVLGSRVSGTEDFVVDGETGWLFECGDQRELETKLRAALNTDRETLLELGARARKRVLADASVTVVLGQLLELYGFVRSSGGPESSTASVPG
jgi:glycosyltransferase involved in cell wall biosynthesis